MNKKGRRGEIWLAEVENKRRPVAVIDKETMVVEIDRVVASVTSQPPRNEYDIVINHWQEAGLDKPSIVRCSKINTLHHNELFFKVGKLHDDDLAAVLSKIRDFFGND